MDPAQCTFPPPYFYLLTRASAIRDSPSLTRHLLLKNTRDCENSSPSSSSALATAAANLHSLSALKNLLFKNICFWKYLCLCLSLSQVRMATASVSPAAMATAANLHAALHRAAQNAPGAQVTLNQWSFVLVFTHAHKSRTNIGSKVSDHICHCLFPSAKVWK
jgi:hypothetical protein